MEAIGHLLSAVDAFASALLRSIEAEARGNQRARARATARGAASARWGSGWRCVNEFKRNERKLR